MLKVRLKLRNNRMWAWEGGRFVRAAVIWVFHKTGIYLCIILCLLMRVNADIFWTDCEERTAAGGRSR